MGGQERFIHVNSRGDGGTRNLFQCRANEQGEDQKKKGLQFKNLTNSGYRHKILAIFHEFFGEDQKKGLRPKSFMKSAVSPQKLRKIPIWEFQASICTPIAPSLLISSGHSPRFGGAQFGWGAQAVIWGGHGPGMPPPRGAGPG